MLKINPEIIAGVQAATDLAELHKYMQLAIELEHSTIPPYLTAMFSIKHGKMKQAHEVIHSIVIEEMMHMTISANILNALGGSPSINHKKFVPPYPGPLPMNIGNGLQVGLEKYSKGAVENTFMKIEEPEDPHRYPVKSMVEATEVEDFATIGQFYEAMSQMIMELTDHVLPGDPAKQVVSSFFSADQLFPILTKEDAVRGINIIVEQGEGTSTGPIDFDGEIAHYYKFEELLVGKRLIKDTEAEGGYSFSGEVIPFDEAEVHNIQSNTKAGMLPKGSEERALLDEFNLYYVRLLNGLHHTFNGNPDFLPHTFGLMYDLKLIGEKLCAMPFPGKDGVTIGPSFEFVQADVVQNM